MLDVKITTVCYFSAVPTHQQANEKMVTLSSSGSAEYCVPWSQLIYITGHQYTYIPILDKDPSSAQVSFNMEFVIKRAKLQYAVKPQQWVTKLIRA